MGTLWEDQCTIFIISHSVLCRMRNTSGKSCRENQNKFLGLVTFFIITVFIILPFMRQCRKILYSRAGHRCQYGACWIPKAATTRLYCDIWIIMHCDIIIESIIPSRNIGCLWVLSTSVYRLLRTLVYSSFYLLPWLPIFSSCFSVFLFSCFPEGSKVGQPLVSLHPLFVMCDQSI
jgi:hypothetical protein